MIVSTQLLCQTKFVAMRSSVASVAELEPDYVDIDENVA